MKVFAQIIVVSIIMMYGALFMSSCTDDLSSNRYELGSGSVIKKTNTEIKKNLEQH